MLRHMTAVGLIAVSIAAVSQAASRPRPRGANPPRSGQGASPPRPGKGVTSAAAAKMTIRSTAPVRWSSKHRPEARRALQAGRRRLVINVDAYEPPIEGPAILVKHLLTANSKKRQEVGRFGIFPNTPFRVSDGAKPQRFLVSLADYAGSLEASEIHLEVGFDPAEGKLRGGSAEISIGFMDLEPPPPVK